MTTSSEPAPWACEQCGRWNMPSLVRCSSCRTKRPRVGGLTPAELRALNSPQMRETERHNYQEWLARRREPDRRNTAELVLGAEQWMA